MKYTITITNNETGKIETADLEGFALLGVESREASGAFQGTTGAFDLMEGELTAMYVELLTTQTQTGGTHQ